MVSWAVSNIRVILGLYGDNRKDNGNHYNGVYRVCVRISPILKPSFYKSVPPSRPSVAGCHSFDYSVLKIILGQRYSLLGTRRYFAGKVASSDQENWERTPLLGERRPPGGFGLITAWAYTGWIM